MNSASTFLEEAARAWAKAQLVHEAPSWDGEPASRRFVEQAASVPGCHDGLVSLLSSPNQVVVVHALQALELMGSQVLRDLPDELCNRRQNVTFQSGSFRTSMDLGGYARRVRERARRAGRSDPASGTAR